MVAKAWDRTLSLPSLIPAVQDGHPHGCRRTSKSRSSAGIAAPIGTGQLSLEVTLFYCARGVFTYLR